MAAPSPDERSRAADASSTGEPPTGRAALVRRALSAGKRAGWFTLGRFASMSSRPVFVLGNQKAGTTAVGALLATYAGLSSTLDFRYLTPAWLRGVHDGSVSLKAFVRHYGLDFSRGLVKEPNLSLLYPRLAEAFPTARFAMVVRDPRDNVRSVLNRLKLPGDTEYLPEGWDASVNPVWRLVLDGDWLGLEGGNHVESLASRWNAIADVYLENPDRIALIRYEDFVADKEAAIAELAAQCGLTQQNSITDRVDVQYQSRGNRAVSWTEFFGPDNLRRLEDRVGDRMAAFGYAPSAGDATGNAAGHPEAAPLPQL